MQVAFYGGSFNPPHVAHVMAVTYMLAVGRFDRVLVVPVGQHAFDKPLLDFSHRKRMCDLAMGWLPRVEVSSVEEQLEKPSRTLRTLQHLTAQHSDWQFRLVVGADQLAESEKWQGFKQIVALAPPLVLGRIGVEHRAATPAVLPGISSTEVRDLLRRRGQPDVDARLALSVPSAVLDYIQDHELYR